MPTAPAMIRFCTTARTWRPQRDLYKTQATTTVISTVRPITNTPLIGTSMLSVTLSEPSIHCGSSTPTSRAPNTER